MFVVPPAHWVTLEEAAEEAGLKVPAIRYYIRKDKIPTIRYEGMTFLDYGSIKFKSKCLDESMIEKIYEYKDVLRLPNYLVARGLGIAQSTVDFYIKERGDNYGS